MKLRKYLSLTQAGIMESLQYRLSTFVMFIGNLLYLIVIYFLWKAIYASSGTIIVNGMTFTDTMIYLALAQALFGVTDMRIVWEIGQCVQDGKIVLNLLKPMEYHGYLFWSYSGLFITYFLFTFFPTFITVIIVTHGAIPLGINLIYFVISFFIALLISYNFDFFVGTICFFTESIWGINIMRQVIVLLLSGATIPLAFFPEPLKTIVYHLPFQSIYNAPLTLLLSENPSVKKVITTLGIQLIWFAFMSIISKLFWHISLKKITVNGG